MKERDSSWFNLALGFALLAAAMLFFHGCASAPPSMSISEAEIDAKIHSLSTAVPKNPNADVYNETTGKYELTPDAHDRALRDGMVKEIQDEKIAAMNDYLVKNPPATFRDKLRWAGWGAVLTLVLEVAAYFAAGGFSR